MTKVQLILIDSYTTLVLAGKYITSEADRTSDTQKLVPETPVTLDDGTPSTIRTEVIKKVEAKKAEILG